MLAAKKDLRIERIVSRGHSSPDKGWYDQEQDEFVILLSGRARLRYKKDGNTIEMNTGDYLLIPAGLQHRVEWTDPEVDCVWLAVFY